MTLSCVFWDVNKGRTERTFLGKMGAGAGEWGSSGTGLHLQDPPAFFPPTSLSLPSTPLPSSPGSSGDWSSKGCSTNLGANRTVCRCDHLTFFALLLVTAPLPRSRQCPWGQDSWLGAREGRFCCLAGVGAFGECGPGLQRMGSSLRASPTEADLGQGHREGPHAHLPGWLWYLHDLLGLFHCPLCSPEVSHSHPHPTSLSCPQGWHRSREETSRIV